jgi:hypothetical protein
MPEWQACLARGALTSGDASPAITRDVGAADRKLMDACRAGRYI